jgi:hypothetical protein
MGAMAFAGTISAAAIGTLSRPRMLTIAAPPMRQQISAISVIVRVKSYSAHLDDSLIVSRKSYFSNKTSAN